MKTIPLGELVREPKKVTQEQRYAIQGTTNLTEGCNLTTNVAAGDFMNLLDLGATNHPHRFYRWELLAATTPLALHHTLRE